MHNIFALIIEYTVIIINDFVSERNGGNFIFYVINDLSTFESVKRISNLLRQYERENYFGAPDFRSGDLKLFSRL